MLRELHRKTGHRVAVLVDEYDRPILDAMFSRQPGDDSEPAINDTARANRDFLRGFYAAIKEADAHIRFSFLTGVSKFSSASLFSGLNNLNDITLDRRYGAICGYTESDLDTVFAPELAGLDREQIRRWYNGYRWAGDERMYNPFGVLMLFDRREFGAWWFETGSPAFLVETLVRRRVASAALDQTVTSEDLLSAFDVDHISTEALLFQTGYLTIGEVTTEGVRKRYRLAYPNLEVRQSLNEHLLRAPAPRPDPCRSEPVQAPSPARSQRRRGPRTAVPRLLPRAFRTSGTPTTTSPTTRATTPACSIRTSPRSASTSPLRRAPAGAAWTWQPVPAGASTCSSSRSSSRPAPAPR